MYFPQIPSLGKTFKFSFIALLEREAQASLVQREVAKIFDF
jgi:hypothetical protein